MAPTLPRGKNEVQGISQEFHTVAPELQLRSVDPFKALSFHILLMGAGVGIFVFSLFLGDPVRVVSTLALVLCGCFLLLAYRYARLMHREPRPKPGWEKHPANLRGLTGVYWMYIMGSGGHTSEMLMTIKASLSINPNMHRRYVITTGDKHSLHACQKLEHEIRERFGQEAGTSDVVTIQRARAVHQSLLSAVLPALWSVWEAIGLLTRAPDVRSASGDRFRYPSVIVTNGPGTCFVIAFVAFILRVLDIVPKHKGRIIYIETWAHITSLSLTGKLFDLFGIADLFCVQHPGLAQKLSKYYLPAVGMPRPKKASL